MKRTKKLAVVIGLICGAMLSGCGNKAAESDNGEVNTTINVLDIVGKEDDAANGELIEVDPFERLDVVFMGTAPNATVEFNYARPADYPMSYHFAFEPEDNLRNGDVVRMYITDENAEQIANDNGYTLTSTEKEYVVEGVDYYVESLDQITDELREQMNESAKQFIENNIRNGITLENYEYIGSYLLSKVKDVNGDLNCVYNIYQINASCPSGEVTYYCYTKYSYVEIRYGRKNNYYGGTGSTKSFYIDDYQFIGYKTLEELISDCDAIVQKLTANGNYTFESNMTE